MKFKEFMEMYDTWEGDLVVNNDNLIIKDKVVKVIETRHDLFEMEVVAFGFYNNTLYVRVK